MASNYCNEQGNRIINYYLHINNLNKSDIGRALGLSNVSVHKYCNNPFLLTTRQLLVLCGLFNVEIEVLVYSLHHSVNKPGEDIVKMIRDKGDSLVSLSR